jgi:peptidyl-prolyl cis-trans isomerase C
MNEADRERVVNDVIGLVLLAQRAEKDGLTDSRTLAAQIELQRLQRSRAQWRRSTSRTTADRCRNPSDLRGERHRLSAEQYKLRHILVETKAEADRVIAQLNQGSDCRRARASVRPDRRARNDGDLGWLTADSMPPSFADAVRAMAAGSYSPAPVQTDAGFHVILLEETQRQQPPALEDLRADLSSAAERKRLDDYIKTLRESAMVTVEQ